MDTTSFVTGTLGPVCLVMYLTSCGGVCAIANTSLVLESMKQTRWG